MKSLICLGIESTAHTFGVGIVDSEGKILSNIKDTYKPKKGWGLIPMDVARHHEEVKEMVLGEALKKANLNLKDIDLMAFSQGPGLPPSLHVGHRFAQDLAKKTGGILVPVNHCIAHIEIGRLETHAKDPIVVYVSGGNTQIISYNNGKYRIFGETQDIGIGNALDKFGREAGMEFPMGPRIEELARKGEWIELPYTVKGMDLSFSGIVTEAIRQSKKQRLEDVCYSLQETMFSMLTEVTERALAHTEKKEVLLTGGVAANRRLEGMMQIMCRERGAKCYSVSLEYAGDNGAMIAWTGILSKDSRAEEGIKPSQRTDQVDITWV